jgi:DNA-binding CsgD family transcriptional regulator
MNWHDPFKRCPKPTKKIRKPWINPWKNPNQKRYPLTDRQKMVIYLYSKGLKTPEVSEKLGITANTVYAHMRQIFFKLNVHGRKNAIKKGMRK